jgi:hypothetical protein
MDMNPRTAAPLAAAAAALALAAGCSSSGKPAPAATVTVTKTITAPPAPAVSTAACLYVSTDTNGAGTTGTWVQAVSDPQGCPDQLLVRLLAANTGGSWNLAPPGSQPGGTGGSGGGTITCTLNASNTGEVIVSTTDQYEITAKAACGGLEQAGMVPG